MDKLLDTVGYNVNAFSCTLWTDMIMYTEIQNCAKDKCWLYMTYYSYMCNYNYSWNNIKANYVLSMQLLELGV